MKKRPTKVTSRIRNAMPTLSNCRLRSSARYSGVYFEIDMISKASSPRQLHARGFKISPKYGETKLFKKEGLRVRWRLQRGGGWLISDDLVCVTHLIRKVNANQPRRGAENAWNMPFRFTWQLY